MQILYSNKISGNDVKRLERLIQCHLSDMVELGIKLLFKHDQLIHYPNVIRKSGPVIHGWMMRYEAKHKEFTRHAHKLNNFINIAKSLAYRNQELICRKLSFIPNLKISKTSEKLINSDIFSQYWHNFTGHDLSNVSVIDFLISNNFEFRKGLMLLNNNSKWKWIFSFVRTLEVYNIC